MAEISNFCPKIMMPLLKDTSKATLVPCAFERHLLVENCKKYNIWVKD
jgi:hypothetical protein